MSQYEGVLATGVEHVQGGVTLCGEAAPVGDGEDLGRPAMPARK